MIFDHTTADADLKELFPANRRCCFICAGKLIGKFVWYAGYDPNGFESVSIAVHEKCARNLAIDLTKDANAL